MSNLILQSSNPHINKKKRPYSHWKQPSHPRLVGKGVGKTKRQESTKAEKCFLLFLPAAFQLTSLYFKQLYLLGFLSKLGETNIFRNPRKCFQMAQVGRALELPFRS